MADGANSPFARGLFVKLEKSFNVMLRGGFAHCGMCDTHKHFFVVSFLHWTSFRSGVRCARGGRVYAFLNCEKCHTLNTVDRQLKINVLNRWLYIGVRRGENELRFL